MDVRVSAPNRIDLAGGTTDLYPISLLMDGGCTANVAITISSRVILRPRDLPGIRIVSQDLGCSADAPHPGALPLDSPLGLLCRAVRVLPPPSPTEIVTLNDAPAGSGLGASSALLTALITGLLGLRSEHMGASAIIDLACNIETATIGVPAGKQDYIAAFHGGISLIEFGYRGFERRSVPLDASGLSRVEQMLVLVYTGEGRFSGVTNWDVTKAFIDKVAHVRENLLRIRDVARRVCEVIREERLDELPALIDTEWNLRRALAPGVSTPRIEAILEAAKAAGATAGKVCGAGGGGCMLVVTPPARRSAVERAIRDQGGEPLPFGIARHGITLT